VSTVVYLLLIPFAFMVGALTCLLRQTRLPIYAVVAVPNRMANGHTRTWGWFPTRRAAAHAIVGIGHDLIFENGTYEYALIEEVPDGIMGGGSDRRTWWYKIPFTDGPIVRIDTPKEFENIVCFSMG
jgi:hypothetical protein